MPEPNTFIITRGFGDTTDERVNEEVNPFLASFGFGEVPEESAVDDQLQTLIDAQRRILVKNPSMYKGKDYVYNAMFLNYDNEPTNPDAPGLLRIFKREAGNHLLKMNMIPRVGLDGVQYLKFEPSQKNFEAGQDYLFVVTGAISGINLIAIENIVYRDEAKTEYIYAKETKR